MNYVDFVKDHPPIVPADARSIKIMRRNSAQTSLGTDTGWKYNVGQLATNSLP